jgi:hypothetical protein
MKESSGDAASSPQSTKCCLVAALVIGGGSGLLLLLLFFAAVWVTSLRSSGTSSLYNSYLGAEPPPLASSGTWLNVQEPLELADLQGQTVWLEFSFMH